MLVNPPKKGEESYEQFTKEKATELASLRRRAHMATDGFNSLEGVSCNFTEGAMYSFPQVRTAGQCNAVLGCGGQLPSTNLTSGAMHNLTQVCACSWEEPGRVCRILLILQGTTVASRLTQAPPSPPHTHADPPVQEGAGQGQVPGQGR